MLAIALVFGMSTAALAVDMNQVCNPSSVASSGIPSVAPGYTSAVMPKYNTGNGYNDGHSFSVGNAYKFGSLDIGFAGAWCHNGPDNVYVDGTTEKYEPNAVAVGFGYEYTPNTDFGVVFTNPGWFPEDFDDFGISFAFTYSF